MTSTRKPNTVDVVLFRSTPPRLRPIMIILTALALGLLFLGLTLTIVGNWPGYAPYGGNPLKIVGPILLALGIIVLIAIMVDCCVRSQQDDPRYYEKSFDTITPARSTENVYSHPNDGKNKLPPPEVSSGAIPGKASVIPLSTPPEQRGYPNQGTHPQHGFSENNRHGQKYPSNGGFGGRQPSRTDGNMDRNHKIASSGRPGETVSGSRGPNNKQEPRSGGQPEVGRQPATGSGWGGSKNRHHSNRDPQASNVSGQSHGYPGNQTDPNKNSGKARRPQDMGQPLYAELNKGSHPNSQASILPPPPPLPPGPIDTTLDTSQESLGPRKFQWGVKNGANGHGDNGDAKAPPVLQLVDLNFDRGDPSGPRKDRAAAQQSDAPQGSGRGRQKPRSNGEDLEKGHHSWESGVTNPAFESERSGMDVNAPKELRREHHDVGRRNPERGRGEMRHGHPDSGRDRQDRDGGHHGYSRNYSQGDGHPRSHHRSSSGRRKGSGRHRSQSRDKDRGSRSRDSSAGRSREGGSGRRSASVEDLTAMDFTSGKPVAKDPHRRRRSEEEDRGRSHRDRSRDRGYDHRRDRSGERRHRAHHNAAFEPDSHHHHRRGSPDDPSSRDSDLSDRRRPDRDRSRGYPMEDEENIAPTGPGRPRKTRPHDLNTSDRSTSVDDVLSMSTTKNTTVVNPNFTININAQEGSAVHIGLGSNTSNSPRNNVPMIRAGPTSIQQIPAVHESQS